MSKSTEDRVRAYAKAVEGPDPEWWINRSDIDRIARACAAVEDAMVLDVRWHYAAELAAKDREIERLRGTIRALTAEPYWARVGAGDEGS